MSNDGKVAAIQQLRREVGFGCPICRNPFLTWHHFDPPYHVEKHWRPEGMIAMCQTCHGAADAKGGKPGAYSTAELRKLKTCYHSPEDMKFRYPAIQRQRKMLIRVGGNYFDKSSPLVSIGGVPQISITVNEEGLFDLSLELRNKDDDVLLKIENNWLITYPDHIYDMTAEPKTNDVKIWLNKVDVGLEFAFRRVSMTGLESMLDKDWKRSEDRMRRLIPVIHSNQTNNLGERIKKWVINNDVVDRDGYIPLLNIENMSLYRNGMKHVIKDGISDTLYYNFFHDLVGGAVNL